MKILIMNASPRRGGNISRMLEVMKQEAEERGYEVCYERVSSFNVRPCTGCMKCRASRQCVLPADDAQRVAGLISEADILIIGAPCYWSNMPGTLKLFFDRIVYALISEGPSGMPCPLHKGKRAVLLSTSTTPWPFNVWFHQTRGTLRALRAILRWSGFRIVKSIERGGTHTRPLTERDLEKCRKVVRCL